MVKPLYRSIRLSKKLRRLHLAYMVNYYLGNNRARRIPGGWMWQNCATVSGVCGRLTRFVKLGNYYAMRLQGDFRILKFS